MLPRIPIIRLSNSVGLPLPTYTDAVGTSMLLFAANSEVVKIDAGRFASIPTGLACALPLGMEAQIRSLKDSGKNGVIVLNAPLTIDASDRQEIVVDLFNASEQAAMIKRGQPIALLVFSPSIRILWDNRTPNESSPKYTFKEADYTPMDEEYQEEDEEELVALDYETAPYFEEKKEDEKLYDEEEATRLQNEADENLKASDSEIETSISSSHDEAAFLKMEDDEPYMDTPSSENIDDRQEETSSSEDINDGQEDLPYFEEEQPSVSEDTPDKSESESSPDIPDIPNIPSNEEDKNEEDK